MNKPDGIDLEQQIVRMKGEYEHCKELHGEGAEMTDDARGLLREAVKVIDSLDAIIAGEISNDWADFFGKDWEDMYNIKSRITAHLAAPAPDQWVKCSDRLPTKDDADRYGNVLISAMGMGQAAIFPWTWLHGDIAPRVHAYWQPLPPLPKEQK